MEIRCTTNPGLEDIASDEIAELLEPAGVSVDSVDRVDHGLPGVVTCSVGELEAHEAADRALVWRCLSAARSLYHVVIHVAQIDWHGGSLEKLCEAVREIDLNAMEATRSFRVRCRRTGTHSFQSVDVERSIGTVLHEKFGTSVDMVDFTLNVCVDITDATALIGYQLSAKKGLDRRYPWQFHPRVTLRTPVAYAMLRLVGFTRSPGRLHDPYCGSGTIVLEATAVASGFGGDVPQVSGSDWNHTAVEGAQANILAAGQGEQSRVFHWDARELSSVLEPGSLDYIVTNPPFGIRMARDANFLVIYGSLLREARPLIRAGGAMAVLVGKRRGEFNKVFQSQSDFEIEHVRVLEIGGVHPGIFVLRRR